MRKVETIVTVEITDVMEVEDNQVDDVTDCHKTKEFARLLGRVIKAALNADGVKVTKVQDFAMDKECGEDGRCEMDKDNN